MTAKYIINGELTADALITTTLLDKCTFAVGPNLPVKTDKDPSKVNDKTSNDSKQFHQKFFSITYPDGQKGSSVILPEIVVHHATFEYYGKLGVYIGVPRWIVDKLKLKFSNLGANPVFEDKKIASDDKYFWTKATFVPAEETKEYIRSCDDEGEEYFPSFPDFFNEYPSSVKANVTCSLKMLTETAVYQLPTDASEWRFGLAISMVTAYDVIDIAAPTTGTKQKSMSGKKDMMRPGLKKVRKAAPSQQ